MSKKNKKFNLNEEKDVYNKKSKTTETKTNADLVCAKIEQHFQKSNRDAMPTFVANDYVKAHTVWVSSVVNSLDPMTKHDAQYELLEGKLPFVLNARDTIKAEYNNSLFKTPEILFNVDTGVAEDDEILKQYYLQQMIKGGSINSYMAAMEKRLNRGEFILFHTWQKRMKKVKKETTRTKEDGSPDLDKDGMPQVDITIEDELDWEGCHARAIEPHDFFFDTTKLPDFCSTIYDNSIFEKPSCFKIVREWMSVNDICKTWDVSAEDKEKLRELVRIGTPPATEKTRDNYTNRLAYRKVFGNMIEIIHYIGDLDLDDETLDNYYIVTAGSEVVLECNPETFSKCRVVWCPRLVDVTTLRGLSELVPAIYMNEIATKMQLAKQDAIKFAIQPAYLVPQGSHLTDDKKTIEVGTLNEVTVKGGSIGDIGNFNQMFKEVDGYKNIPALTENIQYYEQLIKNTTATNTDPNASPVQGAPDKTALQSMAEITSGCTRFSSELLDFVNFAIIPSIRIHLQMIAEYTDKIDEDGNIKQFDVKTTKDGVNNTKQLSVELLKQSPDITIGSIQAIIEKKAKIQGLLAQMQFYQQMGVQYDTSTAWLYTSSIYELQDASKWIQSDPLQQMFSKMPPPQAQQMKQMFGQIAQNPRMMQQVSQMVQQSSQPQPQQVPMPMNQLQNDIAALTIWTDSKLTKQAKIKLMQDAQIIPPQEIQLEMQVSDLQAQKKMQDIQQGAIIEKTPNSQLAKGI